MYHKTDIAMLYGIIDIRTFNKRVALSGLDRALPKINQKRAVFFPPDMVIIQQHLGNCKNWESYSRKAS